MSVEEKMSISDELQEEEILESQEEELTVEEDSEEKEVKVKKKKSSDDDEDDDEDEYVESVQDQVREKIFAEAEYSISEELGSLFEDENLSEEFREKAITVLETAVNRATRKHLAHLDEYMVDVISEAIEEKKEELEEQTGRYMDYVVKEWREENQLAIQSGVRTEIAESFMSGLKDLLEQHYVEIPEEKEDMYQESVAKSEELESSLQEQVDRNIQLEEQLDELKKTVVLESFVSDIVETKADKIRELAEDLPYESEEDFREKLGVLQENYFPEAGSKGKRSSSIDEDMITEDAEGDVPSEVRVGGAMAHYMSAISKFKNHGV